MDGELGTGHAQHLDPYGWFASLVASKGGAVLVVFIPQDERFLKSVKLHVWLV